MATEPALRLTLAGDIPEDRLAAMTRELSLGIARCGATARMAERDALPGERSVAQDLFTIALGIATAGVADVAAEYVKGFLFREKKVRLNITSGDGRTLASFDAASIDAEALAAVLSSHLPPG
jgi:hypothetical protein